MFFFKKKKVEKSEKIKNAFPSLPTTRVISERLLGTAVDKTNIVINGSRRTGPPDSAIAECASPSFDFSTKDSSLKEPSLKEPSLKESSLKEPSLNDESMEEASLKEPSLKEPSLKEPSLEEQDNEEKSMDVVEGDEGFMIIEETHEGCDEIPSEEEWGMTRQHGLAPNLRLDRPRPNRPRYRSSSSRSRSSSSRSSSSSNRKVYAPALNMEDILQEQLPQEDESAVHARSSPSPKPRGPRIPRLTARKIPPPSPPQSPVTTKNKDPLLTTPNKKASSHLPVPIAPQKRTDVRKKPARCGLPVACNTTKLPVRRAS